MSEQHVKDLLERASIASLTESDESTIGAHIVTCADCRHAYEAAQIADRLIKDRADESVEPSPFFQTRVLAAWREQQLNNVPILLRLWRSAGALVSSMALTTAALAALSFALPGPATPTETTAALVPTNAVSVVLDRDDSDDQLTDDQIINAIYADPDEAR
jgi:hypothetical protein